MQIENKEEIGFWALALGVLIAGVALMQFLPEQMPLHSIGEALVIAATLAITVDKYLKRRLVKEMSRNVFHFLIGYDLPSQARDRIRQIVTQSTLIRRDCELSYRIEVVPNDPSKVRVQLTVTLFLHNITSEELSYQFRTSTASNSETGQVLRLWCRTKQEEARYEYPPPGLKMEGPDSEGNYWIVGKELKIPPKNVEKELIYEIGAKYESISKDQSDKENYLFLYPTLGVKVAVEYSEDDFTVYPIPKPTTIFNKSEWVYDRFFVSNEQVAVRWVRKSPHATPTTQAVVSGITTVQDSVKVEEAVQASAEEAPSSSLKPPLA